MRSFTDCISKINNRRVDNTKDIGVVMSTYSLIEYSVNYLKTLGNLWQYFRDEPAVNDAYGEIFELNVANAITDSFKFKQK